MADDIASLGIAVDSSQMTAAKGEADKLAGSLKGAAQASNDLAKSGGAVEGSVKSSGASFRQMQETVTAANVAVDLHTAAVGKAAAAHGTMSTQAQALFHAVRSMGEGVAMGVPPTQLLTQQINHLSYAASGQGGLSGAFKEVGGTLGAMITPMRLVVGGAAGVAAAALYIGNNWQESAAQIDRALTGIGQRTGETAQSISKFSNDNASATGLSVAQARNVALEFTKTGNITVSSLKGVGDAIYGYSVLTGKDATDATKEFAGALSGDLVKGAEKINQTYGTMNSATIEYIRTLEMQGNRSAAIQVIMDAIAPANLKAADSVGILSKAYSGLSNVVSNIFNGASVGVSDADKLANLKQQRSDAASSASLVGSNPGGYGQLNTGALYGGKSQQLSDLDRQIDDLQKKINAFNTDAIAKQLNGLSMAGDAVVKSIIPQIDQIDQLQKALDALQAAQNTPGVVRKMGQDDAAVTAIQNTKAALQDAQAESARLNQSIAELKVEWGGVSGAAALTLQQLENQLPVSQAVTASAQMQAQYEAAIANAKALGKNITDETLIAQLRLENSQAAASAAALKQAAAISDSTDMIKAQVNGNEASTAAAIAYKNAIAAGADSMSASAVESATLDNYMARANASAGRFGDNMRSASVAIYQTSQSLSALISAYDSIDASNASAFMSASNTPGMIGGGNTGSYKASDSLFAPSVMPSNGGSISFNSKENVSIYYRGGGGGKRLSGLDTSLSPQPQSPDQVAANTYASAGVDAAIQSLMTMGLSAMSQIGTMFDLKNSLTNDNQTKLTNLNEEMAWLQMQPTTIARDQNIISLQQSIDQLKSSTDGLNSTNQDLLSPYYSQDPRTSHIGFRSQGMAAGGYVDVPGSPSANDNMTAIIPVASGERIYVDPQSAKRGVGGTGGSVTNISISMPVTIQGNANKDEVGRTMYQAGQSLARQLQAASR